MAATYDPANIFAKILKGQIPCTRVYEDAIALAFMDIMPCADGHTLVIPKKPARNLLDVAPDDLAAFMPVVHKLARAVKAGMAADGLTVQQFNEGAGGQTVFHLHFHLLPRWEGVSLRPPGGPMANPEVLKRNAEKIARTLRMME